MEDNLNKMFEVQFKAQERLGTWDKIEDDPAMEQQFINQMILACYEEVTEIMRETAYKNPYMVPFGWKKTQVGDREKMKEEIIDLFHFVLNLSIVAGMDSNEFYQRYIKKNKENIARWQGKY